MNKVIAESIIYRLGMVIVHKLRALGQDVMQVV